MESTSGGRLVGERLKELEDALVEYYGALNQLREGMSAKIPEKPEALAKYEQCVEMGIPLVAGGLMDQPHLWLMEVGVIKNVLGIEALNNSGEPDA